MFGAWDEKAGAAGSMYDVLRDRLRDQRFSAPEPVEGSENRLLASVLGLKHEHVGRGFRIQ